MSKYSFLLVGLLWCCFSLQAAGQPYPISFALENGAYVTIVIEDEDGRRVRNLLQNTYFNAGEHTIYWDGYNEGVAGSYNAGPGSNYDIVQHPVPAGTYHVKALTHEGIQAVYEFSPYSPGTPAWKTGVDDTGAWGSDHQTYYGIEHWPKGEHPSSFAAGQETILTYSKTGETGYAFLYLDPTGRKIHGRKSIKSSWAVQQAVRDRGPEADPGVQMFGALLSGKGTLQVFRLKINGGHNGDVGVLKGLKSKNDWGLSGFTAWNQQVAASLRYDDAIAFFSMAYRDADRFHRASLTVQDPRGLWTADNPNSEDPEEAYLYVAQADRVVRYEANFTLPRLTNPVTVATGLTDAQQVYIHDGELYVSDWGPHQIKVFDLASRQLVRTIGEPGGPQLGFYDEAKMAFPTSMRVDAAGKLWVAERHRAPKRISRWNAADGSFDRAWYGGPKYGGGGMIDPGDSTRFYYAGPSTDVGARSIELKLDWVTGTYSMSRVLVDHSHRQPDLVPPGKGPEYPRRVDGFKYMVNNNQEKNGRGLHQVAVWRDDERTDGLLRLVGVVGIVGAGNKTWDPIMEFGGHLAHGLNPDNAFFAWSDFNENGAIDADEVQYRAHESRGVFYLGPDMGILTSRGYRSAPPRINARGIPEWDLSTVRHLPDFPSSNNTTDILAGSDVSVSALGPITAVDSAGALLWTYHSQWPNRNHHGGRNGTPVPLPLEEYPGQILAHTRFMGDFVTPGRGAAGDLFALNTEKGPMHLITKDGYYLTKLLEDARTHPLWRFPAGVIERGSVVEGVSPKEEHFWPSISQSPDGSIFVVAGKEHSSILRLRGFETVERHDFGTVAVTGSSGKQSVEVTSYTRTLHDTLRAVTAGTQAPHIDGDLQEWPASAFRTIDPFRRYRGAVGLTDDALVVAFDLPGNATLLQAGEVSSPAELPEGGGGIDLWIGREGAAADRTQPVEGDVRLFITRQRNGDLTAIRYEPQAAQPAAQETFSSPVGSYTIRAIREVGTALIFAQRNDRYEVSIPRALLGIDALDEAVRFDLGVILGDGREATVRLYWNDKITTIVDDLPSELRLHPDRWGILQKGTSRFGESGTDSGNTGGSANTHVIQLHQGWNQVGSYIQPETASMAAILGANPDIVMAKDANGRLYMPAYGINAIGSWKPGAAYQIFASAPTTITLEGSPVDPTASPLALEPGWNLVPYLLPTAVATETALASIADALVLAKDMYGSIYFPEYGLDTIRELRPGGGYKIYVSAEATLTYPAVDAVRRTTDERHAAAPSPASSAPAGPLTGSDATLLVDAPAALEGATVVVRLPDGAVVGQGTVTRGRALISVRGDDPETANTTEGARADGLLTIEAQTPAGDVVQLRATHVHDLLRASTADDVRYRADSLLRLDVVEVPSDFGLEPNYPNPFNPATTIRYHVPDAAHVRLSVFDTLGRRVAVLADEAHMPGSYEVRFERPDLASGVYFYRLQAGPQTITRRMMLLK